MQNDVATKKDLEYIKNEILQTTKNDIQNVKNELLDKLVDKDQYQKDMDILVTKEEFKQELAKLVTKKEFRQQLAKELSKFATKDELRWEINQLRGELLEFKDETNSKLDRLLQNVDGLVGMILNDRVEKAAAEATFQRHEEQLLDHETRIAQLEEHRI